MFLKYRIDTNKKNYSTQRNLCKNLLKNTKKSYSENLGIKKITDNRSFSRTDLPLFTENSSKGEKINLVDDGKTISSDDERCETFNKFCSNVIPALDIPKPKSFPIASDNLDPIMSVIKSFEKHPSIVKIKAKTLDSIFYFRKTSCIEVEKIISNLNIKKSCLQVGIPTKIIKLNKDLIGKFITENFNSCIDEGDNQLYQYSENILFSSQYGFREAFSTQHCLIILKEKFIKAIDTGNKFGTLLTDLPKAFDCLEYSLLVAKLH